MGVLSSFASSALGIDDPRDQEAVRLIEEIVVSEVSESKASGSGESFRLASLTPYLKTYRFHQKYPWAIPTGIVLGLVGFGYLAYSLGRGRR